MGITVNNINVGTVANDGTGDSLRTAGQTINENFSNIQTNAAPKDNVLLLNNTTSFTPDADYEPATKKYVDDNAGADYGGLFDKWTFIGSSITSVSTGQFCTNSSILSSVTQIRIAKMTSNYVSFNYLLQDAKYLMLNKIGTNTKFLYNVSSVTNSSGYVTFVVTNGGGNVSTLSGDFNISIGTNYNDFSGAVESVTCLSPLINTGDSVDVEVSMLDDSIGTQHLDGLSASSSNLIKAAGDGTFEYYPILNFGFAYEYQVSTYPTAGGWTHNGLNSNIRSATNIKISWTENETSKEIEEYLTGEYSSMKLINKADGKWHFLTISSSSSGSNYQSFTVSYVNGTDSDIISISDNYIIIFFA